MQNRYKFLKAELAKKEKKSIKAKAVLTRKMKQKQNKTNEKVRKSKKTLVENDESSVKNTA